MLGFLFFSNLEFLGVFMGVYYLIKNLYLEEEYSMYMKNSVVNFWMVLLIVLLFLMTMMMEFSLKMSLSLLFLSLLVMMQTSSMVIFFLLYEMVFILIMFVIIMLGYSYERLMAAFLMMFYSFLFSSPLLMMILLFDHSFLLKSWLFYMTLMKYFFVGSFMVKFPIFGFHYWLPVAHVEASTLGSMLLAGILLKLGCVGLWYTVLYMQFLVKFHWMSISVILLMLMILSLSDLKMMIAYSSVAHMSMVFYVLMLGSDVASKGALFMMFYHGIISPLMFWSVGILAWWKTRSLLVIKMMSFSYIFILCLFILMIMNMGFPPFMGFMSEILMLKSMISMQLILMIFILGVLFSCYYNIYLYWCFNNVMGMVFKMNFFNLDLFLFLVVVILLNFF